MRIAVNNTHAISPLEGIGKPSLPSRRFKTSDDRDDIGCCCLISKQI